MKDFNEDFEVIGDGKNDEINILADDMLDKILGGVTCKKDYSASYCGCGYDGPVQC